MSICEPSLSSRPISTRHTKFHYMLCILIFHHHMIFVAFWVYVWCSSNPSDVHYFRHFLGTCYCRVHVIYTMLIVTNWPKCFRGEKVSAERVSLQESVSHAAHAIVPSLQIGTQWIMWVMLGTAPILKIMHIELSKVIESVIMTMRCWVVRISSLRQSLWLEPQMHTCEFCMHLDMTCAHIMHKQSDLFLHLARSYLSQMAMHSTLVIFDNARFSPTPTCSVALHEVLQNKVCTSSNRTNFQTDDCTHMVVSKVHMIHSKVVYTKTPLSITFHPCTWKTDWLSCAPVMSAPTITDITDITISLHDLHAYFNPLLNPSHILRAEHDGCPGNFIAATRATAPSIARSNASLCCAVLPGMA